MKFFQLLSKNILGGLFAANSPSTSNRFLTLSDATAVSGGTEKFKVKFFQGGDIAQNTVFVGNFVELLSEAYTIKKITVLFGEQSMNTNKTIPIEIKTLDTDSAAPTATLQYTANVNAVVGAIQNKVYTFTPSVTLPINKLLTVNTGAFTASTQILRNCLVTLTLEKTI
jgi:tRNA U34 2-thiouridine synthase MnmA/TrmU